jgi:outer membrane protein assembly factor BamB
VKFWPIVLATSLTMAGLTMAAPAIATPRAHSPIGAWDWPTYGHDGQHTFHGRTTLTPGAATTLAPAWFFPTGLAVTATPTVVARTVYVGSWDGHFYAIALDTG